MSYALIVHPAVMEHLRSRCVEPQQRKVAGRYGWAIHRFPIKGGITVAESMGMDLARPSFMGARLLEQGRIA